MRSAREGVRSPGVVVTGKSIDVGAENLTQREPLQEQQAL